MLVTPMNINPRRPVGNGCIVLSVLGDSLSGGYIRHTPLWFDMLSIITGGAVITQREKQTAEGGYSMNIIYDPNYTDIHKNWLTATCTHRVMCFGTNDVTGAWTGNNLQIFAGKFRATVTSALLKPEPLIVCNIAPKSNATMQLAVIQANEEIRKICEEFGVVMADIHSRFVGNLNDYMETGDDVHWNNLGCYVVAQAVLEALKKITPVGGSTILSGSYSFPNATSARGLVIHSTPGASWGYGGAGSSAVTSLTTNPAVFGQVNKAIVTASSGNYFTHDTGDISTGFSQGDVLLATVKVRAYDATGGTAARFPGVSIRFSTNLVSSDSHEVCPATYVAGTNGDTGFMQFTHFLRVPANVTWVKLFVSTGLQGDNSAAAAYGITYEFGELFIWNLTNRGILL